MECNMSDQDMLEIRDTFLNDIANNNSENFITNFNSEIPMTNDYLNEQTIFDSSTGTTTPVQYDSIQPFYPEQMPATEVQHYQSANLAEFYTNAAIELDIPSNNLELYDSQNNCNDLNISQTQPADNCSYSMNVTADFNIQGSMPTSDIASVQNRETYCTSQATNTVFNEQPSQDFQKQYLSYNLNFTEPFNHCPNDPSDPKDNHDSCPTSFHTTPNVDDMTETLSSESCESFNYVKGDLGLLAYTPPLSPAFAISKPLGQLSFIKNCRQSFRCYYESGIKLNMTRNPKKPNEPAVSLKITEEICSTPASYYVFCTLCTKRNIYSKETEIENLSAYPMHAIDMKKDPWLLPFEANRWTLHLPNFWIQKKPNMDRELARKYKRLMELQLAKDEGDGKYRHGIYGQKDYMGICYLACIAYRKLNNILEPISAPIYSLPMFNEEIIKSCTGKRKGDHTLITLDLEYNIKCTMLSNNLKIVVKQLNRDNFNSIETISIPKETTKRIEFKLPITDIAFAKEEIKFEIKLKNEKLQFTSNMKTYVHKLL